MVKSFQINRIFKNDDLREFEQDILSQMLREPEKIQRGGIRQLAKDNYTSPATIDRLAKKVGYSGYSELLYNVKLIAKSTQDKSKTASSIITNILAEDFETKIKEVLSPKRVIYLYGEGFNEFIINYIYRKLIINKYKVILLQGIEIPLVYQTGQETSVIIISRSGENFVCMQKIEQAKKVNSSILSITSNLSSSISKASDIAIQVTDKDIIDMANQGYTTYFGDCINLFEKLLYKVKK